MIKHEFNLYVSALIFSLFLLFSAQSIVFAGTYIYYNEKGEEVLYLPKKPSPKISSENKKISSVTQGPPAGIPYEHKKKQNKQNKTKQKIKRHEGIY